MIAARLLPSFPTLSFAGNALRRLRPAAKMVNGPAAREVLRYSLARRATLAHAPMPGAWIHCTRGCVWITLDGDCRDVVLQAGERHQIDRDSRVVLCALEAAELSFA